MLNPQNFETRRKCFLCSNMETTDRRTHKLFKKYRCSETYHRDQEGQVSLQQTHGTNTAWKKIVVNAVTRLKYCPQDSLPQ